MIESEVRKKLAENGLSWESFIVFMYGQTVGVNNDGSTDFFEWDVEKFIRVNTESTKPRWYNMD